MSNATLGGNAISAVQGGTGITVTGGDTVNLDTPVDETNGGTGQTTYATGDILYASAANTLSKLAAGSEGEVLTLASGVPAWAAGGGGGVWNYIASATASNSSEIEFTGVIDSTYKHHVLVMHELVTASPTYIKIELSSDNGSSYITSGYKSDASTTANLTTALSLFVIGTTTGGNTCHQVDFFNMADSINFTATYGIGSSYNSGSSRVIATSAGSYNATTSINAFRILANSGNILTGEFILYGVSES